MPGWRRVVPVLWSVLLAALALGPALGPGYVLSYDMVWVPDLALRPDILGVGSGLPRAVPSDTVVAVLDEIVPGMLLQKVALLGALAGGGLGILRLAPRKSLTGQLVAVSVYQWNPFVAERLVLGHWPLLVGYAVLPWLVLAAREWRTTGVLPWRLCWLVPLGSLSASAGLATGVVLVAFAAERRVRRWAATAALLAVGNAPWLVSGLLHAADATTDPAGASAFALHSEGVLPAPVAALGLGGIWNAEVVPASRDGLLGWLSVLALLGLAAAGLRGLRAHLGRRDQLAFIGCVVVAWLAAVLTWAVPSAMTWTVSHLPGAGLLRDGTRILAVAAPGLALAVGHGAARLTAALRHAAPAAPATAGLALVLALVLLPLALLPDLGFGVSGRLGAVGYPDGYARARAVVSARQDVGASGDVVLLPFSSYRQPVWNGGRKVLDPTGRYLTPDYLAADDLLVSGVRIAGEDPRARAAVRVLARPTPEARSRGLAALGIRFAVTDLDVPGAPRVAGRALMPETGRIQVQELAGVRVRIVPSGWRVAMALAWAAYIAMLGVGGFVGVRRITASRLRGGGRPAG